MNPNRRKFLSKAVAYSGFAAGVPLNSAMIRKASDPVNHAPNSSPVCTEREGKTNELAAQPTPTDRKFVDVHVHITQTWNERGELTARNLLRWMDVHDIGQAWVLPLISPEAWYYPITTEFVLEETRPFRDRLIPFCVVDPRTDVFGGFKHFVDLLGRYKNAGARGFGEHKWGGAIDDPRNIELLKACGETGLPVLFHLDNDRNKDVPGLPGLERLLKAAPETTLIGHGPGWWASICGAANQRDLGGYPRGQVAPNGALDRLLGDYPNLYADLSAGSGHNAIRRDLDFGRDFMIRNADKMLLGTDYLADKQEVNQFELLDELNLPVEIQQKIFRDNAHSIIGDE